MTEKQVQLLGFVREEMDGVLCEDETGKRWVEDGGYYYYYSVTKGLSFISSESTKSVGNNWFIEVFNTDTPVRFKRFEDVQALINKLEKAKIHENTKEQSSSEADLSRDI